MCDQGDTSQQTAHTFRKALCEGAPNQMSNGESVLEKPHELFSQPSEHSLLDVYRAVDNVYSTFVGASFCFLHLGERLIGFVLSDFVTKPRNHLKICLKIQVIYRVA